MFLIRGKGLPSKQATFCVLEFGPTVWALRAGPPAT